MQATVEVPKAKVTCPCRSFKPGALQAQLRLSRLPPEGGPVASSSRVMTPCHLASSSPMDGIPASPSTVKGGPQHSRFFSMGLVFTIE